MPRRSACQAAERELRAAVKATAEPFGVIIGGGGVVGLALAGALSHALGPAFAIAVVDRLPFGGARRLRDMRASAVSAGSKQLLTAVGAWSSLADRAQPVTAVD